MPCTGPEIERLGHKVAGAVTSSQGGGEDVEGRIAGTQKDDRISWGEDVGQRDRELGCVM